MTRVVEFFCNFCNRSMQRREPGVERMRGYVRLLDCEVPYGWDVTSYDGVPGAHICNVCIEEGRAPETAEPAAFPPPAANAGPGTWPAHASPFGASPEGIPRG